MTSPFPPITPARGGAPGNVTGFAARAGRRAAATGTDDDRSRGRGRATIPHSTGSTYRVAA
ncbi:hypothetical protein ACFVYA_40845 [Amycolatopsis sp. NPDC058278]|uniref:hypothetical protein n=1 Tax=Amycolatopsis sp. NPDC058278 TaxID=3346417 RepID=UPI0036D81185